MVHMHSESGAPELSSLSCFSFCSYRGRNRSFGPNLLLLENLQALLPLLGMEWCHCPDEIPQELTHRCSGLVCWGHRMFTIMVISYDAIRVVEFPYLHRRTRWYIVCYLQKCLINNLNPVTWPNHIGSILLLKYVWTNFWPFIWSTTELLQHLSQLARFADQLRGTAAGIPGGAKI